jgi:hypothetical protein
MAQGGDVVTRRRQDREHFFAVGARAMRQQLIDIARALELLVNVAASSINLRRLTQIGASSWS